MAASGPRNGPDYRLVFDPELVRERKGPKEHVFFSVYEASFGTGLALLDPPSPPPFSIPN
jgi:hypothetical protein